MPQAAANAGFAAAHNALGLMHFTGQGAPKNFTAARRSYEDGADLGDPDAIYNLGTLYASGRGVELNLTEVSALWHLRHDRALRGAGWQQCVRP